MSNKAMTPPGDQAARNKRTALILGAIALVFFIGVFVRMAFFGR